MHLNREQIYSCKTLHLKSKRSLAIKVVTLPPRMRMMLWQVRGNHKADHIHVCGGEKVREEKTLYYLTLLLISYTHTNTHTHTHPTHSHRVSMQSSVITFTKGEERGASMAALAQNWSLCDKTNSQDNNTTRTTHLGCVCVCVWKRDRGKEPLSLSLASQTQRGDGNKQKDRFSFCQCHGEMPADVYPPHTVNESWVWLRETFHPRQIINAHPISHEGRP